MALWKTQQQTEACTRQKTRTVSGSLSCSIPSDFIASECVVSLIRSERDFVLLDQLHAGLNKDLLTSSRRTAGFLGSTL